MICRGCGNTPLEVVVDLGAQPLANELLRAEDLSGVHERYPLAPEHCARCQLVQLPCFVARERLFAREYPYFTSQSQAFVKAARIHAIAMAQRLELGPGSLVVEIGSNDGYLLKWFCAAGIPCYGIDPARAQALAAIRAGVPTLIEFFDAKLVCEELLEHDHDRVISAGRADLVVANNVLAHVDDLHGFCHGARLLLAPEGVLCIEVPWLCDLVSGAELGTIYHEHHSYFLLASLEHVLELGALRVFDVARLPDTHGGSLRVMACHPGAHHAEQPAVATLRAYEQHWLGAGALGRLGEQAAALKRAVWRLLVENPAIAGYGAAAKAVTLLSWAGVSKDVLPFVADTTVAKQGRYMPGSLIPIVSEDALGQERPELIWILAPNHAPEIAARLREGCDWDPVLCWQHGVGFHYDRPGSAHEPSLASAA